MKVRIPGLAAVLALVFAVPASAHFYSPGPVGAAPNCHVNYDEAKFVTAANMGPYHGGFLRAGNILSQYTYSEPMSRGEERLDQPRPPARPTPSPMQQRAQ